MFSNKEENTLIKAVHERALQPMLNEFSLDCIVGCIYKHPCMKIDEFNSSFLTPLLYKLSFENKDIFLMGDFNVNLL